MEFDSPGVYRNRVSYTFDEIPNRVQTDSIFKLQLKALKAQGYKIEDLPCVKMYEDDFYFHYQVTCDEPYGFESISSIGVFRYLSTYPEQYGFKRNKINKIKWIAGRGTVAMYIKHD
jgi:hypothetical protein